MFSHHPTPDPVGPGQQSVWDFPRPPSAEVTEREVVVEIGGREVARTTQAVRVCETSHPPVFYIPAEDIAEGVLQRGDGASWCEFKGTAVYWDALVDGVRTPSVGWSYPRPTAGFEQLAGAIAFYPSKVGRALVDGETVQAQDGDFYGGWITTEVVGPFKGGPGSRGW